jgi:hypothetical protein
MVKNGLLWSKCGWKWSTSVEKGLNVVENGRQKRWKIGGKLVHGQNIEK